MTAGGNHEEKIILKYKIWLLPAFAVFTIRHLSQIFQNLCVCFHCKQINCQCQSMTVYQFALYAQLMKALFFGKCGGGGYSIHSSSSALLVLVLKRPSVWISLILAGISFQVFKAE